MNEQEYNRKTEHIYHMNALIRSLNDEDATYGWLMNGVPDGVWSLEEVVDTYDNDEFFDEDYDELVALFTRIISRESKNGTDSKAMFY